VHDSKIARRMAEMGRIEHILSALPPLATEERTFGIGSSVRQERTHAPQQKASYSITSSARASSTANSSSQQWAASRHVPTAIDTAFYRPQHRAVREVALVHFMR
jgi:hypothetical protein